MKDEEMKEQADIVKYKLLKLLENLIDTANTKEEKLAQATKKMSLEALAKAINGEMHIEDVVVTEPNSRSDDVNAFALAICLGDVDSVKRMLPLFDKDSINNKNNFVFGYRQIYTFMHLVVNPQICVGTSAFADVNAQIEAQIAILHLLADAGADPSFVIQGNSDYSNAPLAAGQPMGHTYFPRELMPRLRGALLLVGADPDYIGSSYNLTPEDFNNAMQEVVKQYFNMPKDRRQQVVARANEKVIAALNEIIQKDFVAPLKPPVTQLSAPRSRMF